MYCTYIKKIILLISLLLIGSTSYAQEQELLDNTWYLTNIILNGQDNFPPYDTAVPTIPLDFGINGDDSDFYTAACDALSGGIMYTANNFEFELSNLTQTLGGCMDGFDINYQLLYFGFYFNNQGSLFNYFIEDEGGGALRLRVTGANGMEAVYGNSVLGITEVVPISVILYPNPVAQTLYLRVIGKAIEQLSVYSLAGELLFSEKGNTEVLDVSGLAAGLYFVEVSTSEGKSIQQFIKK